MSREQIIRDTAYAIWEAEGKPSGRAEQHWKQAEERVALSATEAPKPKAVDKGAAPARAGKARSEAKAKTPSAAKVAAKTTSKKKA